MPDQSNEHYEGLSHCWHWDGRKNPKGYGMMKIAGRNIYAHRVSFAIANDEPLSGACVMHKCDNPSCVNPSHLIAGSIRDNNYDAIKKGRAWKGGGIFQRGETHTKCKLSDSDVAAIRDLRSSGERLWKIAQKFGVTHQYVSRLCAFKYRK